MLKTAALLCLMSAPLVADSFVTFTVPNCESVTPISINSNGDITGVCYNGAGPFHGFIRAGNGAITVFDAPGADDTIPLQVNDAGVVAGTWDAQSDGYRGHG